MLLFGLRSLGGDGWLGTPNRDRRRFWPPTQRQLNGGLSRSANRVERWSSRPSKDEAHFHRQANDRQRISLQRRRRRRKFLGTCLSIARHLLFSLFVPSFTYVVVKCPYMVKEWLACQDCRTDRKVNIWRLAMVFPCYERTCWPNWENSFSFLISLIEVFSPFDWRCIDSSAVVRCTPDSLHHEGGWLNWWSITTHFPFFTYPGFPATPLCRKKKRDVLLLLLLLGGTLWISFARAYRKLVKRNCNNNNNSCGRACRKKAKPHKVSVFYFLVCP